MIPKRVFVKRKKFTEAPSNSSRMLDRWDQQVFFILQKFPHAATAISMIQKEHAEKLGSAFIPSEQSLAELANLQSTLT